MSQTDRLALPYIMAAQAQKHVTHNEAIRALDALVQLVLDETAAAAPPGSPADGACVGVGTGATGAFAGRDGTVAQWVDGAWMFHDPGDGWAAYDKATGEIVVNQSGTWVRASLVSDPALFGINASASLPNRLTVSSAAALFNHEGDDAQIFVNRATDTDTASFLFETGFAPNAEFGLTGSGDFTMKVADTGAVWRDALTIDRDTGEVAFPQTAAGIVRQFDMADLATAFTTNMATMQATGLSLSFTPLRASSRLLVRASLVLGARFWQTYPEVSLRRDGSKVWPASTASGLNFPYKADSDANSSLHVYCGEIAFIDTPGTTSAVTYDIALASNTASYDVHLNRNDTDTTVRGVSTLSVTELA